MKRMFYTEAAYFIGLVTLALGTALMERADFGMSMVVAPAYLVYLKVSEYLNWFSFGMAEYCFQAFLIIVLAVVLGSFKRRYLFSFITAFIYGNVLDIMMKVVGLVPGTAMSFLFIGFGRFEGVKLGTVLCALINGWLIGKCSRFFEKHFDFVDGLRLRKFF